MPWVIRWIVNADGMSGSTQLNRFMPAQVRQVDRYKMFVRTVRIGASVPGDLRTKPESFGRYGTL